jgi:hypothetical protein
MQVALDQDDHGNFSKCLGISARHFRKQCWLESEASNQFVFKEKPCPFLKDNRGPHDNCRLEARRSCTHAHKNDFVFRLTGVIHNSSVCPIVFRVYEYLKAKIWHVENLEYFDGCG